MSRPVVVHDKVWVDRAAWSQFMESVRYPERPLFVMRVADEGVLLEGYLFLWDPKHLTRCVRDEPCLHDECPQCQKNKS